MCSLSPTSTPFSLLSNFAQMTRTTKNLEQKQWKKKKDICNNPSQLGELQFYYILLHFHLCQQRCTHWSCRSNSQGFQRFLYPAKVTSTENHIKYGNKTQHQSKKHMETTACLYVQSCEIHKTEIFNDLT